MGIVLQNLIGFAELDILKVLPVDLQDLQKEKVRNPSDAFYQTIHTVRKIIQSYAQTLFCINIYFLLSYPVNHLATSAISFATL